MGNEITCVECGQKFDSENSVGGCVGTERICDDCQRQTIQCPLCSGSGTCADHVCPECHGTGRVPNVFAELRHGQSETDEETAAAEGRPLAEVQAERRAVTCPACGKLNPLAHEDGAVDGPREYHAACWHGMSDEEQRRANEH